MNDGKDKKIDRIFVVAKIISKLLAFDEAIWTWYSSKFAIFC